MKLQIKDFSHLFQVVKIDQSRLQEVYMLCKSNPLYYQHMPPLVTRESIADDLRALPPGKTYDDKYYVGFYKEGQLCAVMDLIAGYPDDKTAFIGFFMVDKKQQGTGIGSKIIKDSICYIKTLGYIFVQLGYVKGNLESENFWKKNHFQPMGSEQDRGDYCVVKMQYTI